MKLSLPALSMSRILRTVPLLTEPVPDVDIDQESQRVLNRLANLLAAGRASFSYVLAVDRAFGLVIGCGA